MSGNEKRGCLALIGGSEDRRYEKEVLKRLIEVNDAKIVAVVPTATSYPRECADTYIEAFEDLGIKDINIVDVRYADEANEDEYVGMLEDADLIYFTGGDQCRLSEILLGSKLMKKVFERFNKGATVAGTSAGAAAAAERMIFSWQDDECLYNKGCVNDGVGFGFIKKTLVDTHFLERGRIPRLALMLAAGPENMALGVCEDTMGLVYPDNTMEVVGSGVITVLIKQPNFNSNYKDRNEDENISTEGIRMTFVASGKKFDLSKKKIIQ
ncbi:MAG: cyanophycinase [Bacillota bacterium]